MKNKLEYWSGLYILLIVLVAVISWIGNIYGLPLKSLFAQEGIRWEIRNVMINYTKAPLAEVLCLCMGIGLMQYGGLRRELLMTYRSVKQRRALILVFTTGITYLLAVIATIAYPHAILLSATGSVLHSPFTEGLVFIISLGCGIIGLIYGIASGQIRNINDVHSGLSYLIARMAPYLVVLFLASQLVAFAKYSQLIYLLSVTDTAVNVTVWLIYLLPLTSFLSVKRLFS